MYKVMLVDDEQILRRGMRKFIPWERCGFEVCYEAENGVEALHFLRHEQIDLVVLDIRMPEVSGLELLSELAEMDLDLDVIVISGYNDFDFVREAMRHKVVDYLLKPVKPDEVVKVLNEIFLRKEQAKIFKKEKMKERNKFIEMIWFRLANDIGDAVAQKDLLKRLSASYEQAIFQMIKMPVYHMDSNDQMIKNLNILYSDMPHVEAVFIAKGNRFSYTLLLVLKYAVKKQKTIEEGIALMQQFPQLAGVSYSSLFELSKAEYYFDSTFMSNLDQKVFYNVERLSFLDCFEVQEYVSFTLTDSFIEDLIQLIKNKQHVHAKQKLSELYYQLSSKPIYNIASVHEAYRKLISCVYEKNADILGGKLNIPVNTMAELIFVKKDTAFRLKTLHDAALEFVDLLFEYLDHQMLDTRRRLIREVTMYVEENLEKPVVLNEIANNFNVSVEYLSQLFKKEMGINFSKYLRQSRIKKAMRILNEDCNIKIYELAAKVGYGDAKHFSKVFHKATGYRPREYIENKYRQKGKFRNEKSEINGRGL